MDTTPTDRCLTDELKASIREVHARLAAALPGFRARRSQNIMVARTSHTLATSGARAVIEAPTGTGKSMAYLTAGIPVALSQGRRLVISTGTVALQEQVCNRDIPAFLRATGLAANVTLAKGRNRWACTHKLMDMAGGQGAPQDELFDVEPAGWSRPPQAGEAAVVETLATALTSGDWDGDLDNPAVSVPDALKPMLSMPSGGCLGRRCAFYRECPVQLAKEEVKQADVIVTNHSLLMQSLKQAKVSDGSLPNFLSEPTETLYVLDEGHGIGSAAIEASAQAVHLPSSIKRLAKLRRLAGAAYRFTGEQIDGRSEDDATGTLEDLTDTLQTFHDLLKGEWVPEAGARDPILRLPQGELPEHWRPFAESCRVASLSVMRWLANAIVEVGRAEGSTSVQNKLLQQLGLATEMVDAQLQLWKAWSSREIEGPPTARWLSVGSDGGLVCHASPVTGAEFLRETLWSLADSVVVTSATLSTAGDFGFIADELGTDRETEFLTLPSPFNLGDQAVLEVPAFPVLPDDAEHPARVAEWMASELDWGAGNLVLFTSRKKLEACAAALPPELRAKAKVQGERAKQALLDEHARDVAAGNGSTLMGLISWGEGLDLPGELVTTVVVSQVPFSVPSDPVGATKAEWYEREGRNPFVELSVPEALRTLTQFTGRLIRRESDRGRIVVLDRRLVKRRYGRTILDGLPPFRRAVTA